VKQLITNNLLDPISFSTLLSQQETANVNDSSGLFNVIKNIQNRKCSANTLCIELGSIFGDFNQLKPVNKTLPVQDKENVHLIIKPIILIPQFNKTEPVKPATNVFTEDCEDVFPRFKQEENSPKYYRKIFFGDKAYTSDMFKQGLNLIILERNNKYEKIYERTFDTNNNRKESDEMADILQNTSASKIIIVTGIGKWIGALTNNLIKQLKQIGGPDLNNLLSGDINDNSMEDRSMIVIGRRGVCRYNGIFKTTNYDISKDLKQYFPELNKDPNDCLFENVKIENERNKNSAEGGKFYHLTDLRLFFDFNKDNRFAYDAPTVSEVSPYKGSVYGGQEIKIAGFNFGEHNTDIKEILVRGVTCADYLVLSPTLISCVTRSSFIGAGAGNIIIKLNNGKVSPLRTCNYFEYISTPDPIPYKEIPIIENKIIKPVNNNQIPTGLSPRRKRLQEIMTELC
jgi:hypothetical protein